MAFGIPAVTDGGHIRKLDDIEADMIRLALHRYRGQMSEVARKLGIGRSTLYRKMRDLGSMRRKCNTCPSIGRDERTDPLPAGRGITNFHCNLSEFD